MTRRHVEQEAERIRLHPGPAARAPRASGAAHAHLLFDDWPEDQAVARNGEKLRLDFGAVETVVLSHGHSDRGGGMPQAVRRVRQARPDGELRCHLHPGMFRQRGLRLPHGEVGPMDDAPGPEAHRAAGGEPVVGDQPVVPLDGPFLVSGLIDVLTEARRMLPELPIHAGVGGFHLAGGTVEPIVPQTVRDPARFEPRSIVPARCTGRRALTALVNAFAEARVVPDAVGKRIEFGGRAARTGRFPLRRSLPGRSGICPQRLSLSPGSSSARRGR